MQFPKLQRIISYLPVFLFAYITFLTFLCYLHPYAVVLVPRYGTYGNVYQNLKGEHVRFLSDLCMAFVVYSSLCAALSIPMMISAFCFRSPNRGNRLSIVCLVLALGYAALAVAMIVSIHAANMKNSLDVGSQSVLVLVIALLYPFFAALFRFVPPRVLALLD